MHIPRLRSARLFVPLALFIPNLYLGQEAPQLTTGRLSGDARPQIDGRVDDEPWSTAPPYSSFTQQEPDEGEPATERTEIRFLIDRDTDRRDTSDVTSDELLGRSFIVKYTRLFDY